jgi:hypothetical protein
MTIFPGDDVRVRSSAAAYVDSVGCAAYVDRVRDEHVALYPMSCGWKTRVAGQCWTPLVSTSGFWANAADVELLD